MQRLLGGSIGFGLLVLGACQGGNSGTTAAMSASGPSSAGSAATTTGNSATGGSSAGSSASSGAGSGGSSTGDRATSGTSGGKATGGSNLVAKPTALDFGNVEIDAQVQKTVTLTEMAAVPASGVGFNLTGVDSELFTVANVPRSLDAGTSAQLTVTYAPLSLETSSSATLELTDSDGSSASVSLTGAPVGVGLTVTPDTLDFGYVPPHSSAILCVTVAASAGVSITVNGLVDFADASGAFASSPVDGATPPNRVAPLPVTIAAGNSVEICFSFTPQSGQQYNGQVTLLTDDPSGANPFVFLTGWGGGPEISCTPASIDFQTVKLGQISTLPVTCTNTGTAAAGVALILGAPSAGTGPFAAECDAAEPCPDGGLAPGDSAKIDVTYTPVTPTASDTGTLTVPNNGGQGVPVSIPLSGEGGG